MRTFEQIPDEKFDKYHAMLLVVLLGAVIVMVYLYAQNYKKQVEFNEQIRELKSQLSFCQAPEGTLDWDDI